MRGRNEVSGTLIFDPPPNKTSGAELHVKPILRGRQRVRSKEAGFTTDVGAWGKSIHAS